MSSFPDASRETITGLSYMLDHSSQIFMGTDTVGEIISLHRKQYSAPKSDQNDEYCLFSLSMAVVLAEFANGTTVVIFVDRTHINADQRNRHVTNRHISNNAIYEKL